MKRRWVPALVLGGLWWWAVLRLALQSEQAGLVEGAVAAGGWGLSLLPVHVASMGAGGSVRSVPPVGPVEPLAPAGPVGAAGLSRPPGSVGAARALTSVGPVGPVGWLRWWRRSFGLFTRAWRRRRSGGGSGRS